MARVLPRGRRRDRAARQDDVAAELIDRQLAAGAWGITAATVQQVAMLGRLGVRRVLIANEVVDPHALSWLARRLDERPGLDIIWYVDSEEGLLRAEQALAGGRAAAGSAGRARVIRRDAPACATTSARCDWRARSRRRQGVDLVGVSGYEGTIGTGRDAETDGRGRVVPRSDCGVCSSVPTMRACSPPTPSLRVGRRQRLLRPGGPRARPARR